MPEHIIRHQPHTTTIKHFAIELPDMPHNTNAQNMLHINLDAIARTGRTHTLIKGYHYPLGAANPILRNFLASLDPSLADILPKIDVTARFTNPNNVPVHSTIVTVDHRRFLIVGYFDILLPQNLNVKEVFPHLPWHGELAVFSLGKRKHLLSRPAGGRYVIAKAITLYIRAVVEMRMAGYEAPFQLTYPSTFGIL